MLLGALGGRECVGERGVLSLLRDEVRGGVLGEVVEREGERAGERALVALVRGAERLCYRVRWRVSYDEHYEQYVCSSGSAITRGLPFHLRQGIWQGSVG